MAVTNSEFPQESPICDFDPCSPQKTDSLYLDVVGISPSPRRTITKKIDFCNYNENDEEDKYKWYVDSDGDIGPFFYAITDKKEFDKEKENPVSMGGEGHA